MSDTTAAKTGWLAEDYGLMVQSDHVREYPPCSYIEIHRGQGKQRLGRQILDWWAKQGQGHEQHQQVWEGSNHRQRAEKYLTRIIEEWRRHCNSDPAVHRGDLLEECTK